MARINQGRLTSLQHPLVKHLVKLREERRYRLKEGSCLVHGDAVIRELADERPLKRLFVEEGCSVDPRWQIESLYEVTPSILKKVSGVAEPQRMVAELTLPAFQSMEGKRHWLVLDRLQDPGNMGTLLRTALALGWEGAFVVEGSVDPFNAKALQAGKGAVFRLPLAWGNWEGLTEALSKSRIPVVYGDIQGEPLGDALEACVLILGQEGQGISAEAKQCGHGVTIPMNGEMESLNVAVAGGIMMYVLRGERR